MNIIGVEKKFFNLAPLRLGEGFKFGAYYQACSFAKDYWVCKLFIGYLQSLNCNGGVTVKNNIFLDYLWKIFFRWANLNGTRNTCIYAVV